MSSKPRKGRKAFVKMPSHKRVKSIAAHLSGKLKKDLGKRSVSLRKGDRVKAVRGAFKGKAGKVTDVDHAKLKIMVEGIKRKRSDGTEIQVPVDPSNVIIEELDKSDAKRFRKKGAEEKKEEKK